MPETARRRYAAEIATNFTENNLQGSGVRPCVRDGPGKELCIACVLAIARENKGGGWAGSNPGQTFDTYIGTPAMMAQPGARRGK